MFGDALYKHLFPVEEVVVAESAFLVAMTKLRDVCVSPDHHGVEQLCFSVFAHHHDNITKQGIFWRFVYTLHGVVNIL